MTIEQAKQLKRGDYVHTPGQFYAKSNNPKNAKVTSIKTWKTRPDEIEVHTKYGMYTFDVFRERDLHLIEPGYVYPK